MAASVSPGQAPAGHRHAEHALALLNNWIDYVPRPQRRLGLFIFFAAFVHVTAFFFILIDTTRPELRHQMRTQVTLENALAATADTAEGAFWDRLTDPRLHVLPLPGQRSSSPSPDLASAFGAMSDIRPVPMPSPVEIGNYPFLNNAIPPLEERVEETMHPVRQPFAYEEHPPAMAKTTTWQWEEGLAARHPSAAPALPSPVSDTEISPTRLRVAVSPSGAVSDVLLDASSHQPDLDRQAILEAGKIRFQSADRPTWGFVTVSWYYTPKPREVAPPAAPLAP